VISPCRQRAKAGQHCQSHTRSRTPRDSLGQACVPLGHPGIAGHAAHARQPPPPLAPHASRLPRASRRARQERFARHAGFERSNYGAIERGEFNARLDTIVKVAVGLDMTVAALCEKAKI
jgi:DNA-binding XRE family transcriptional regulator